MCDQCEKLKVEINALKAEILGAEGRIDELEEVLGASKTRRTMMEDYD